MHVETSTTVYISGVGREIMDKISREANCWAEGQENACLTLEEAIDIPELEQALRTVTENGYNFGDVIVSL